MVERGHLDLSICQPCALLQVPRSSFHYMPQGETHHMPSPPSVLKTARDPGVTNVRNLASPHWRRWLEQGHRCLVPVASFSEPRGNGKGVQWFAPTDRDATMFFAGIETRGWTSLRKVKDGETTDDLYAFLTCPPSAEVASIHPKAMPVILTRPEEWTAWLGGICAEEL